MNTLPAKSSSLLEERKTNRRLADLLIPDATRDALHSLKLQQDKIGELARNGLSPITRLLFYGPPGNGKTASAEALACLLGLPLLVARFDQIINSYHGESEKRVVGMFREAAARPCVLFCDEADSLLTARVQVGQASDAANNNSTNLMLTELDGLHRRNARVVFIAATNRAEYLDPAALRRFHLRLDFPPPTAEQKRRYLAAAIKRMPLFRRRPKCRELAAQLDAPSFAELETQLENLARRAILYNLG